MPHNLTEKTACTHPRSDIHYNKCTQDVSALAVAAVAVAAAAVAAAARAIDAAVDVASVHGMRQMPPR